MKVKAFEHVIQMDDKWGNLEHIDAKVNRWLAENPTIEVVDVKLSTCAGTNNERAAPANFCALCLVFYNDAGS